MPLYRWIDGKVKAIPILPGAPVPLGNTSGSGLLTSATLATSPSLTTKA